MDGPKVIVTRQGRFHGRHWCRLKVQCDDDATSRRSGPNLLRKKSIQCKASNEGLTAILRATYVTRFMQSRGIASLLFTDVPEYAASPGCVGTHLSW